MLKLYTNILFFLHSEENIYIFYKKIGNSKNRIKRIYRMQNKESISQNFTQAAHSLTNLYKCTLNIQEEAYK